MTGLWQGLNDDTPARLDGLLVPVQPTKLEFLVGLSQESNAGPIFSDRERLSECYSCRACWDLAEHIGKGGGGFSNSDTSLPCDHVSEYILSYIVFDK